MTLRLNLASGTDIRDGWINLDVVDKWPSVTRGCDVHWDARSMPIPYPDESADEVYAGYLLLHLGPRYHASVLDEIRRVLKPGAPCVFGEVDMMLVMLRWLKTPDDNGLSYLIWGEQGVPAHGEAFEEFDQHHWGFTEGKLRDVLARAGFCAFERIQVHHPDVWYELTIRCTKP